MNPIKKINSLKRNIHKAKLVLKHEGFRTVIFKTKRYLKKNIIKSYPTNPITDKEYQKWFQCDLKKREEEIKNINLKINPKISILMPTFYSVPSELRESIESVINQNYENWELYIYVNVSSKQETKDVLKGYENKDKRIKIKYGLENKGISNSLNEILESISGKYLALMNDGDLITKDALFWIVKTIEETVDVDYIYTDEDLLNDDGEHINPNFKTDWSKYLAEQTMYPLHMSVYKTTVIKNLKFEEDSTEIKYWDLLLKSMTKENFMVAHIPKIIYSCRLKNKSKFLESESNFQDLVYGKKTIREYLISNNINAEVINTDIKGIFRIKRRINGNPLISIIIPTKDKVDLLKNSVDSVLNASYKNTEVIIISNNSKEKETFEYFNVIKGNSKVKVIEHNVKFNFSELNNYALQYSNGEILLFLNNDVKSINKDWIEAMLEYCQLEDVGVVGAKLIFGNNTIQHAGIIYGTDTGVSNTQVGYPAKEYGYNFYLSVVRDYSAVIGACFMIKKKDFIEAQMFDENLGLIHQEVDLCFKLIEKGKHVLFTPYAQLYHFESSTRGKDPVTDEWLRNQKYFETKWKEKLSMPDPFYNPNLSKTNANYSLDMSICK